MKYIRSSGWHVMVEPPDYDGTNNNIFEPIQISEDLLIILISNKEYPCALNMIKFKKNDNENNSEDNNNNKSNEHEEEE